MYIGGNDHNVYALDPATGKAKWQTPIEGPAIAIPAVYQNLVIAAGGSGDGTIYAMQKDSGAMFWKYKTGGKIDSDPIVQGDKFYVSSADGFFYSFKVEKTTVQ